MPKIKIIHDIIYTGSDYMEPRGNKIVRKLIYFIIFAVLVAGFVYLGEKYKDNSLVKTYTITDYYPEADSELFEVVSGSRLINILKSKDSYLVLIGSSKSEYSKKYLEEIQSIAKELNIEKIEYYDLRRDKTQKNSNYYEIRKQLNGFLTTTDGSEQNLLAPSFYILKKVK